MGLEKAKSLLEVKGGKTFLDLIAEQIKYTRQKYGEGGCWEVLRLGSEWSDGGGVHWCVGLVLGGGGGGVLRAYVCTVRPAEGRTHPVGAGQGGGRAAGACRQGRGHRAWMLRCHVGQQGLPTALPPAACRRLQGPLCADEQLQHQRRHQGVPAQVALRWGVAAVATVREALLCIWPLLRAVRGALLLPPTPSAAVAALAAATAQVCMPGLDRGSQRPAQARHRGSPSQRRTCAYAPPLQTCWRSGMWS